MSGIAAKIKGAQDKDGMLRRALERIIQLYTDKSHFVYELLQNAEDAGAKSIRFVQYNDRLEVFHNGKPFTTANLQGLCDIGKSDKVDDLNQIGEFGVGFKSVFGICETVRLYSNPSNYKGEHVDGAVPFAVEIRDFTNPEDIEQEEMPALYTTRFVFPYAVGCTFSGFSSIDALNRTLSQKLQNLGITTLLFMKNLETIEYQIERDGESVAGDYLLEKAIINDHCQKVSAIGTTSNDKEKTDDELISYLKFSRKIKEYGDRTVDIAFPIKEEEDAYQCIKPKSPYVSVYFPTETESKLDFIVQGPYRTTPNRSSIPSDDPDNIFLAKETAKLLRDSLLELKEAGKLNMSFVKIMPLGESAFEAFNLFMPVYETIRDLFRSTTIIPSKSGEYVSARYAKISRQERLANVFSDEQLSSLINDGGAYYWLPTFLTETNREYKHVLEYFTSVLNITVIRPEDLRIYFAANPNFLPEQTNAWLVALYSVFESIPAAFSISKNETNMTTAAIVKTSEGTFVAPYRKEGKTLIPNVFLPSKRISSVEVNYVDEEIYERSRGFFDDILRLDRPDEYEFLIKDIRKRYEEGSVFNDKQHIEDIKALLKYSKREEYAEEVLGIIKDILLIRCKDQKLRSPYEVRIFLPVSTEGIDIESYYRNISQNVFFADVDYYFNQGLDAISLMDVGVRNSILSGETIITGNYESGARGRQPEWWTTGDFRWKLSVDALKDVLLYISNHPTAKDSILKSQTIMKLIVLHQNKLCGEVHISGVTPNLINEPCEMIHILRGDRMLGWDGRWLFTESGENVSPETVSKYDISTSIYGKLMQNGGIYNLLGFRRTEADDVDELRREIPQEKLEAYFESELKQRYGLSTEDLNEKYGGGDRLKEEDEEVYLPFPQMRVKSWDALRKHAAEMLIYADPVRYESKIRRIRVSNSPKEAKAYLQNMYRHEGENRFKYACQLCHETCSGFEATELFLNPETELDPLHLCLCPNCAMVYRGLRSDEEITRSIRRTFFDMRDADIENNDQVVVAIDDDDELWFTQTHFAEIRELMKLAEEAKSFKIAEDTKLSADDENEKDGMSVYSGYLGKTIRHRDLFTGTVEEIIPNNGDYILMVHITDGDNVGASKKIKLAFVLERPDLYSFSD